MKPDNYLKLKPRNLSESESSTFYHISYTSTLVEQGWKIHISAGVNNAPIISEKAICHLVRNKIDFKIVKNSFILDQLNKGQFGITQIGKFITIYPHDLNHFYRLIEELDFILKEIENHSPVIATDIQLHKNSIIYFRYGAYKSFTLRLPNGKTKSLVNTINDKLTVDAREPYFVLPDHIKEPFKDSKKYKTIKISNIEGEILHGKYYVLYQLHNSYKSEVHRGINIAENSKYYQVVIKSSKVNQFVHTQSAFELLKKEYEMYALFDSENLTPGIVNYYEKGNKNYLITEYIDGITLEEYIAQNSLTGYQFTSNEVAKLGLKIVKLLEKVHDKSLIFNDLKPSNIMIDELFNICLIDLESLLPINTKTDAVLSTRGFRNSKNECTIQNDIYAVGVILYSLCTNINPTYLTREFSFSERPIYIYNSNIDDPLIGLIDRIINKTDTITLDQIYSELTTINEYRHLKTTPKKASNFDVVNSKKLFFEIAKRTGYYFSEGEYKHQLKNNFLDEDAYNFQNGDAGILFFMSALYPHCPDKKFNLLVESLSNNLLANMDALNDDGFYTGKSGVVYTLINSLAINENLNYQKLIELVDEIDYLSLTHNFCYFDGISGIGDCFVECFKITKDPIFLAKAEEIAMLISENFDNYFTTESDFSLGFAYGLSGVAYFLTNIFSISKNKNYENSITKAKDILDDKIIEINNDIINFPVTYNSEELSNTYWYNGISGIVQFYLQYFTIYKKKKDLHIINRLGNLIFQSSFSLQPTKYNGISGALSSLLKIYSVTKNEIWLEKCNHLCHLVKITGKYENNTLLFPGNSPTTFTTSFLKGHTGVAYELLRFSTS